MYLDPDIQAYVTAKMLTGKGVFARNLIDDLMPYTVRVDVMWEAYHQINAATGAGFGVLQTAQANFASIAEHELRRVDDLVQSAITTLDLAGHDNGVNTHFEDDLRLILDLVDGHRLASRRVFGRYHAIGIFDRLYERVTSEREAG